MVRRRGPLFFLPCNLSPFFLAAGDDLIGGAACYNFGGTSPGGIPAFFPILSLPLLHPMPPV